MNEGHIFRRNHERKKKSLMHHSSLLISPFFPCFSFCSAFLFFWLFPFCHSSIDPSIHSSVHPFIRRLLFACSSFSSSSSTLTQLLLLDFFAQWFRMETASDLLATPPSSPAASSASQSSGKQSSHPQTTGSGTLQQKDSGGGVFRTPEEEHKLRLQTALRVAEEEDARRRSRMSSRHSRFGTMIAHESVFVKTTTTDDKNNDNTADESTKGNRNAKVQNPNPTDGGKGSNNGAGQTTVSVPLGRRTFIRNVFDLDAQRSRNPSDRGRPYSGRRGLPDPPQRRYLSGASRLLQTECLQEFLTTGAASELLRAVQKTLLSSRRAGNATAELQIVQPQDWENFFFLSGLILEFQRVRAKR